MMIEQNANRTATVTVMRSRFFSATVEPAAAVPIEDPNMSDRPPPRPECKRIKTMRAKDEAISIPMRTSVSTTRQASSPKP